MPGLDLNAFTAGVEPGGLTHGYEIKILVCYLLRQLNRGMTFSQINDALCIGDWSTTLNWPAP